MNVLLIFIKPLYRSSFNLLELSELMCFALLLNVLNIIAEI